MISNIRVAIFSTMNDGQEIIIFDSCHSNQILEVQRDNDSNRHQQHTFYFECKKFISFPCAFKK
jgi:hypothetical protein